MKKLHPPRFIVIDNDWINNLLCNKIIKVVSPGSEVVTFETPNKGFKYIKKKYSTIKANIPTVLFLDINMPIWSGWDFLEHFEALQKKIQDCIKIYILSSSVNPSDIERAKTYKCINDFIMKPITMEKVEALLVKDAMEANQFMNFKIRA